jgi:membrane-associated PAP2 superfamily phosphatase
MSRFVRGQALIALALGLVLLLLFEATDLDRLVADRLYDPFAGSFPLRYGWFLEAVMHRGAKIPLYLAGAGVPAGLILSFILPRVAPLRGTLLFLVLALGLGPGAVAALKVATGKHCPWDLEP